MNEKRAWITIAEAGQRWGISSKTIYSLIARGRLPRNSVLRLGRSIRLNPEIIEAGSEDKNFTGRKK